MKIRTHPLPVPRAMIGGLTADPVNDCLWLGLGGSPRMIWRFDLATRSFHDETPSDLTSGYSYVHRSVVARPDGTVNVGLTWVMGIKPKGRPPQPFSPHGFGRVIGFMRRMGNFFAGCRILERDRAGRWSKVRDGRFMSVDLVWDGPRERLLRLTPRGANQIDSHGETPVFHAAEGFVHKLAISGSGQGLFSDDAGDAWIHDPHRGRIPLGSLRDVAAPGHAQAVPGIDGAIALGSHYFVGGTRNHARPFVVDLRNHTLTLLGPTATAPRLSAITAAPDGSAYLASGVGRVELHRLDPGPARVTSLGQLQTPDHPCHHLHDLVQAPDGRLFGGEFFPLDVPDPPWPSRECQLWEIEP